MFHTGRCGSTVLANLLNQHSQVVWDGEIFKPPRWKRPGDIKKFLQLSLSLTPNRIFGFEAKFFHIRFHGYAIGAYMEMLRDLGFDSFIVIRRNNHLRQILSSLILRQSATSHIAATQTPKLAQVRLDVENIAHHRERMPLLMHIDKMNADYRELENLLSGDRALRLTYEGDIAANPGDAYEKVCAFLGVEPEPVSVRLGKGNPFALKDMIANYADVAQALCETPHEWMLRD